jgi:hypothetical protein
MVSKLMQIVKEEVNGYFSDWQVEEPSIADKYYEKKLGISKEPDIKIDAELIGYIDKEKPLIIDDGPYEEMSKNL